MGYDKSLGSKTYQTVSGAVAYDDPQTGRTLHLIINWVIHISHLDHHLLCAMQCCVNDVTVNDLPKFLAANPTDQSHALTINDPDNPLQPVILPLTLRGVTLLLNVRTVTINEFNSQDYPRLHLTSETLTWDPTTTLYEQQKNAMINYSGNIVCDAAVRGQVPTIIVNELQLLTTDMADMTHDCNFHQVLTSHVIVSIINASLSGHVQLQKTAPIDFMTLVAWWMIAPERTKITVQLTMQQGICTCLNPTLAQRFSTNDKMLCYKQLPHTTFTDTLFADTPSRSANKCAQAYSTSFGWARAHPMNRKGKAHETLSLLFHRDGVPPTMYLVVQKSNSKETLRGNFARLIGQTVCRSTLWHLYNKDIHCSIHQEMHRVLNESITHNLGPNATEQDFPAEVLTPDYNFYDDDHDLDSDHSNLEVTPEMGVNYLNTEISVPCGETLVKGRILPRKGIKTATPLDWLTPTPSLTRVSTHSHSTMVMRPY